MSPVSQLRLAGAAIALLCAWNARELVSAWQHSPYDRLGWLALLLWVAPLAWMALRQAPRSVFFYVGLGLSALGTMAELNLLTYAGLACACAGFVVHERRAFLWLAAALSWMPAFGWLAAPFGATGANAARVLLALAGTAFLLRRHPSTVHA